MKTHLSVVEICAGAGGQSLGLHMAGFRHDAAVEVDKDAAATLRHNLDRVQPGGGPVVVVGDVTDSTVWRPEDHQGVDLLAAGVPCPPFSAAGKQLGARDERDLYAWTAKLAARIQPRALLIENVAGLAGSRFSAYRQYVADLLADAGYVANWRKVNASDFGVAQLRPRFVLVALRQAEADVFRWPEPVMPPPSVGTVLGGLMAANGWAGAAAWAEAADSIAPTLVGGSKKHGGPDLGPTRARRGWTALGIDGRGLADEAPSADTAFDHVPRLTTNMAARVQGFNTSTETQWEFLGRKTSRYRQIGNAFPPPVAAAIGTAIRAAFDTAAAQSSVSLADVYGHSRTVAQDPVFALLNRSSEPVSAAEMAHLGSPSQLRLALSYIARDFSLEIGQRGDDVTYRLPRVADTPLDGRPTTSTESSPTVTCAA